LKEKAKEGAGAVSAVGEKYQSITEPRSGSDRVQLRDLTDDKIWFNYYLTVIAPT
jgi:hypothetical protein